MSRNGSGVYSLPAGNPVVTGTTISSSWANTTLSDIATALTGSVAADGQTAMTGNLQMGNNKITGLAVATSSGDALSYGQAATISALTVSGAFAANGGATLGDASGDALTINSSAVSIPNGLNFDSNTLVIDATNDRVGVGTSSPGTKLDVYNSQASGISEIARFRWNNGGSGGAITWANQAGTVLGQIANSSDSNGNPLLFYAYNNSTALTERMRIDSSGNVGIGTSSPSHKLTVAGNLGLSNNNAYGWGDLTTYIAGDSSTDFINFVTSATERMRIDSSGNVGIGTSSPNFNSSSGTVCHINNAASGGWAINHYTNGTTSSGASDGFIVGIIGSDGAYLFNYETTPMIFGTGASERMRIDSSGNLLVGTTSNFGVLTSSISAGSGWAMSARTTGAGAGLIRGLENSTDRFIVYGNGDAYNRAGVWGSLSDVKLKENIEDATPKLEKLNQVRVVNYNLKTDPEQKLLGVIAQELEQIFPSMVDESPDRDAEGNDLGTTTKQVKYSVFVPMLIKAIQEQQAIINDLKARIETLESK